ncbi:MAG: hypothetical protein OJF49_003835 [Ktedonobacterales bacterium]|nr:MAG: hypothetical protein OJF49_003835 [Ktedonobacterales bacterium]
MWSHRSHPGASTSTTTALPSAHSIDDITLNDQRSHPNGCGASASV